jgi:hypothetical protein
MNDLDDLKAALNEPPDFTPRPLDLAAVMTTGGRIRRRRRLAIGATAGLAVVVLLVGGNVLVQRTAPDGRGGLPVAAQPATTQPSAAQPTTAPPSAAPTDSSPSVIRTGLAVGDGEWVLYAKPIDDPAIPKITFGLMLAYAVDGEGPNDEVMANENSGSDKAPGFHAVQGSMEINDKVTPTFGYYVGPAAKITAKSGRKTLVAKQAPLDDKIQAFWFDAGNLENLTAYDADGKKLPAGNRAIGVG